MDRYKVFPSGELGMHPTGTWTPFADAQATVEALQRERDAWKARTVELDARAQEVFANGQQREAEMERLVAQLDAEREKVKGLEALQVGFDGQDEVLDIKKSDYYALRDELSQLQALVLALPIYEADALITVDGDLDEIDRPALRSAVMELLAYRATLDATTPAPRQRQVHSCEIPGCVSCANPEEGGDGE